MSKESLSADEPESTDDIPRSKKGNTPAARLGRSLMPSLRNQATVFDRPAEKIPQLRVPEGLLVASHESEEEATDDDDDEVGGKTKTKAKAAATVELDTEAELEAEAAEDSGHFVDIVHNLQAETEGEVPLHAPAVVEQVAEADEPMEPPATSETVAATEAEYVPAVVAEQDDEDPAATAPATSTAGGGGGMPPIVPPTSRGGAGASASNPNPGPNFTPKSNTYNAAPPPPTANWNTAPAVANLPPAPAWASAAARPNAAPAPAKQERQGIGLKLLAAFLTGYAVKGYIESKRTERREEAHRRATNELSDNMIRAKAQQAELRQTVHNQTEQLARHQRAEQVKSNQPTHFEKPGPAQEVAKPRPEALPPVQVAPEQEIFDQEGNKIVLQPGWRVERSAGGYSVVVDQHNRVVNEAIHYGEAYQHDQKREKLSDDIFAAGGAGASGSGGGAFDSGVIPAPMISSGQIDVSHELAPGRPTQVDLQHRLPKPRNQLAATAASPWLWTAIAFLIIIYFIAALA